MVEQQTLSEFLNVIQKSGIIRIDSSLYVVNDSFYVFQDIFQAMKEKQEPNVSMVFLVGLYTCSIKNKQYTISVLLYPRNQVLVPPEKVFDDLRDKHRFAGLSRLLSVEMPKHLREAPYYNTFMDVIANEYFVMGSQKDKLMVNKLKNKLRRHRLRHLKEKKVLKNISFPKTSLGDSVKTLLHLLNTETKTSRSRRKRIKRAIRRKKEKLRKHFKDNRMLKLKNELLANEKRALRFKALQEKKEATKYLEQLKTYEKLCKNTSLNPLDILFKPFEK